MSKELVIGSNRHETKVGVLEEDQLVEVYFQRANEYSLAGSIHKGRVTRVLPGMQSAFVDLGLERDTFLYVTDFFEENEDIDTVSDEPRSGRQERRGNDRGDRSRQSQERQRSAPAVIEPRTEPVLLEDDREASTVELGFDEEVDLPVAAADLESELEGGEEIPLETGLSGAIAPPNSAVAGEGDRDERNRGDRRHRRSRRRRGRGRGIPENKYAQPADVVSPVRSEQFTPSFPRESAPEPEASASDVIILPGELLAKYRQPSSRTSQVETNLISAHRDPLPPEPVQEESMWTSVTLRPPISLERFSSEPIVVEVPPAPQPAVQEPGSEAMQNPEQLSADNVEPESETIQEQAADLVFADRVFAHHDDLPVGSVPELPQEHSFAAPFEPVASVHEAASTEEPAEIHTETLAVYGPNASLSEYTLSHETTELEPQIGPEAHEEGFEASEAMEAAADSESEPIEAEPAEQSATLREGSGNRPLQRSSRRMRRRRGGNRMGGGQQGESSPRSESNGTGAAPALDAEFPPTQASRRRESEDDRPERAERTERVMPSISDLLKPGQEIIVQIAKEPLGQKGARITSHVALPGRYVVFMPSVGHLGVSRKIASDEERQRLKRILQTHRTGAAGGFIVRTAGEGVPEDEIAADMNFLYSQWLDIRQKAEKKPAPALLHYDLDIVQRILRDQVTEDFKAIWVDSEDMYENVVTFMQRFQPALVNRVKMYTRSAPIFDAFNITAELEKALRPKVWLKSGGYIVINQTEALVAIDINTGKYVGKSNRLEDTIVKTNTEAVKEIVRQIRLRDLGGIIVVDFIDMDERKNRQKVMAALEDAMRADKAPYKILQFNDFGLVAITRKRVKQSLERTLCSPCPYCEGAGYVKSVQTVIGEILVEAQKLAKSIEGKDVLLRVHPEVAKVLKASDNKYLDELEEILGRPVLVKGDPTLHNEKFDLG